MNNIISMQRTVYNENTSLMKSDIEENIDNISGELMEENFDFISKLIDKGIPVSALSKLTKESLVESAESLDRFNYKMPSFLKIGYLKSWHSTPSKIIGNEIFETESPFIFPVENTSIGIIQNQKHKDFITNVLETIALKYISSLPISLSRVSIIDNTGSGQNFPNLIRLSDKYTDDKIISEDIDIERELEDIKNSISSITSSITANGFTSIEDYNNNTKEVPQAYKVLAIANFPFGFTKKSAESLLSIIESGHKAGVFVVMNFSVDLKHGYSQPVAGLTLSDFVNQMSIFEISDKPHEYTRRGYMDKNINLLSIPYKNDNDIRETVNNDFKIIFEESTKYLLDEVIDELNERMKNVSIRPMIPIENTLSDSRDFWKDSAGSGVSIKFGKKGVENVYLSLGVNQHGESESTYHGLIGGATGSGKTVLLHDIILHGSMKYSPKDFMFWLLDYKEGTEFAAYKDFPHVNILSMESEVEFGQEVLLRAISELKIRGDLFKKVGANNLTEYNSRVDKENILPRILIVIDEFQALFPRNPKVTAITNDYINQILRLGRSFGFNLLLSTQTLKGVDMDPQLMTNMPLRIGLKMDKKDISKLFDESNTAVRFLENPGEGIYNRSFGETTANVNFQAYNSSIQSINNIVDIVKTEIDERFSKEEVSKLYKDRFVYNGQAAGDLKQNKTYMDNLTNKTKFNDMEFYIGEYAGLSKEHAKFSFKREYSDNLLITGQGIKSVSILFSIIALQLSNNKQKSKIIIHNFNKKEEASFNKLNSVENIEVSNNRGYKKSFDNLFKEFENRLSLSEEELDKKESIVNMVFFPEGSSDLNSSNYSAESYVKKFKQMISEGPELGIHVVLYATSTNTLSALEIMRDLDKFKKKIGTLEGNFDKIFGDMASEINSSISKFIMIAHSGESGSNLFKFKKYGEVIC